jgi:hypothetical protein
MWSAERKATWFSDIFKVGVSFERKLEISEQKEAAAV